MKSIKEKAEEYVDFYNALGVSKDPIDVEITKADFYSGANYVLEQIMKILPKEDRLLNDAGKALLWRLNDCVEQLKK